MLRCPLSLNWAIDFTKFPWKSQQAFSFEKINKRILIFIRKGKGLQKQVFIFESGTNWASTFTLPCSQQLIWNEPKIWAYSLRL
jgi:hypothetical protein